MSKDIANEAADKAAKSRAQKSLPNKQLLHEEAREQQRARAIMRTMAAVLEIFPKDERYARPSAETDEEKLLRI